MRQFISISLAEKKLHKLTAGYYNDSDPVFDPNGKYLYFKTDRRLATSYSSIDGYMDISKYTQSGLCKS